MELLALIFIWPFIILATGIALIAFSDVFEFGYYSFGSGFLWIIFIILLVGYFRSRGQRKDAKQPQPMHEQLATVRQVSVIFSIVLLLPIFVRYIFAEFGYSLPVIFFGLFVGFSLTIWGFFIKRNKTLMYGTIIGGAIVLIYVYLRIWELGDFARVLATGVGLAAAVGIAVYKLKDKLS